ncbi:hypothetical protein ACFPYJ_17255 [Paenibacillus solisilvae]|uniref:Nucleotidyl transferase AbiEii/AbiGii toxin family protein n=1 Tax=Paenibacillus solisilvae TaxID=2486751 RepID=A0ABW0VYA3_9BACL
MDANDPINRALVMIAQAAEASDAVWLVGGSTGLMLRGLQLNKRPNDLDLYADEEDALKLHELLLPFSVDAQQVSVTGIYRSVLSHYSIEGISVELVGGFEIKSGAGRYGVEVREVLAPYKDMIEMGGYEIGIVPLAHEMWFNLLRGRDDRVHLIAEELSKQSELHRDAFIHIEARNELNAELIGMIHNWLGHEETRSMS